MTVIVVTGASGFVGTHLLKSLVHDRQVQRIYALDLEPPKIVHDKLHFVRCDVRQAIGFTPVEPVDVCIHLAAICREPGFEWDDYFQGNYLGTRRLAEWSSRVGVSNIVFTSTAMVFRAGDIRHDENSLPNADTGYGISKALAEEVLKGWRAAAAGRRLRIVRPGVVFGRGGGGNFARLHRALKLRTFFYIGRSTTVKSAIYVKDLVRLLCFLATDAGPYETYHGVYPDATTIGKVCTAFCAAFSWKRWIATVPYRPALAAALVFQGLNNLGLRNPVHYRRIQKLYQSTDLSADRLAESGFALTYTLEHAIRDWHDDCAPDALY